MKHSNKTSALIFIICILFQNSYSQQNTNGWYWINSQPQGNDLRWVKIIDATHYYAVGEQGTFMKSSDGGNTWLINTQAGISDEKSGAGGTKRLFSAWFFNANTGIVVGESNFNDGGIIKRTTNGGETFTPIGLGASSGLARVFDIYFLDAATGYLSGSSNVGAFKTTNSGLNWTLIPNLPNPSLAYRSVYAKDVNNILLGVETNGSSASRRIVSTTNAGTSWRIDTLPGTFGFTVEDIVFQNASTGFVAGNPKYFGYTINGGANWTQAVFPNTQQGLYELKLIGSTVYALGSYNSYYYTTNFGVTWDSVVFNDPTNPNQPLLSEVRSFDINGSDAIVVGVHGKVNVSTDGGSSWRNKNYSVDNSNNFFPCIFAQPGGRVWSGGTTGLILYSTNRGTNWTKQQTTAAYAFQDIKMINSTTGYAVGGNIVPSAGFCYKTTNAGVNWTAITIPTPFTPLYAADFVNATTGWIGGGVAAGAPPLILKTTNGGSIWISQTTSPAGDGALGDIDMSDANTGYACQGDVAWKTTNGGNNWNAIFVSPGHIFSAIQTFSSSTVYVAGEQSVNKSTNGGLNWITVTIPTEVTIMNMDWSDINNGTVVGSSGYTAKTKDGGLTWIERNPGSSTITGVSMVSKDTVYASCDRNVNGAIFRLIDISTAVTINIKVGIEGFWNGTVQVPDTVKCHLRNSVSPFAEVAVVAAVTDNQGNAVFTFPSVPSGSYYLEMTQRNSIETWSATPQEVVGGTIKYDFTTSASQAFGNNMILKLSRYCDYSGDVTQDGAVNLTDLLDTYNSSSNFVTGYVAPDVNGDNTVDLTDITIVYNNAANFVAKVTP